MTTTIEDNKIHGENYYLSGRYNYTAIDRTYCNGTGTQDCISGLTKKLATSVLNQLTACQQYSMESLLLAIITGESGNSEALYLYAVNDVETHRNWLRGITIRLRDYLAIEEDKREVYDLRGIVRSLKSAFSQAVENMIDFPKDVRFRNFTELDISVCSYIWISLNTEEYKINGLI